MGKLCTLWGHYGVTALCRFVIGAVVRVVRRSGAPAAVKLL